MSNSTWIILATAVIVLLLVSVAVLVQLIYTILNVVAWVAVKLRIIYRILWRSVETVMLNTGIRKNSSNILMKDTN